LTDFGAAAGRATAAKAPSLAVASASRTFGAGGAATAGAVSTLAAVAEATVRCLQGHVPAAVPGIAFLSGGQSETEATLHLDQINKIGRGPWQLTFSFGRALQQTALATWAGRDENRDAAQSALLKRARLNGLARSGSYDPTME